MRDLDAADADLALGADRHQYGRVIRVRAVHVHAVVAREADREAVGGALLVVLGLVIGHLDGRLRRAVEVEERQATAHLLGELLAVGEQQRLSGARYLTKSREVPWAHEVEEEGEDRGHEVRHGDSGMRHGLAYNLEVEVLAVRHHDRRAAQVHGHPHLGDRAVEGGRSLEQKDVARREAWWLNARQGQLAGVQAAPPGEQVRN